MSDYKFDFSKNVRKECETHFHNILTCNPQIEKIVTETTMVLKRPNLPPKHWFKIVKSSSECHTCKYIKGDRYV